MSAEDRRHDHRQGDGRLRRVIGWMQRPAPRSWSIAMLVAIGLAGIIAGFSATKAQTTSNRQTHDELVAQYRQNVQTWRICLVQSKGLPASHRLAAIVAIVVAGLNAPPDKLEQEFPPSATELRARESLRAQLTKYLALVSQEPATRHCGPHPTPPPSG